MIARKKIVQMKMTNEAKIRLQPLAKRSILIRGLAFPFKLTILNSRKLRHRILRFTGELILPISPLRFQRYSEDAEREA